MLGIAAIVAVDKGHMYEDERQMFIFSIAGIPAL